MCSKNTYCQNICISSRNISIFSLQSLQDALYPYTHYTRATHNSDKVSNLSLRGQNYDISDCHLKVYEERKQPLQKDAVFLGNHFHRFVHHKNFQRSKYCKFQKEVQFLLTQFSIAIVQREMQFSISYCSHEKFFPFQKSYLLNKSQIEDVLCFI